MKKKELSQPVYSTKTEGIDIPVPMRDGVRLAVDVYRPHADGRFPALLAFAVHNKFLKVLKSQKHAIISRRGRLFGAVRQKEGTQHFSLLEATPMWSAT